ncbi:unnamed protein product [Paramecium primaurelia]|uniref:Mitogen-activated protein kinase n=1 Tax=Paramecium primaurelia TaxID=5886 RepID=A0A8S1NPU3_PARPR|nr:unnamed protein product [Paramecium primaurelia]
MSEEIEPHIARKFEIIQKLGKGAYGIVWKAVDKKLKQVVALKKVFDAFHNATDAQRTFREVMFLQELNGHENIVRLLNIIKAENNKDLYLVFDYMETDLHAVIRANILEEIHKKYIVYQTLKALKFIHSGELIHRDLKPSNILLDSECLIKVADFGLARSLAQTEDDSQLVLTEYVATRWYRAPEILLGSTKYSKAVDMWSVGCIIGELIVGKAIFPGTSTLNQIERIIELLGKPSGDEIQSLDSPLASNILASINTSKKKQFNSFFQGASDEALDLIRRLLCYNPNQRLTAEQALKHKYVRDFSSPEEEIVCQHPIKITMNDNKKFTIKEYREALYADISQRKKEQRKKWQAKYLSQLGVTIDEKQNQIQQVPQKEDTLLEQKLSQPDLIQQQIYQQQLLLQQQRKAQRPQSGQMGGRQSSVEMPKQSQAQQQAITTQQPTHHKSSSMIQSMQTKQGYYYPFIQQQMAAQTNKVNKSAVQNQQQQPQQRPSSSYYQKPLTQVTTTAVKR